MYAGKVMLGIKLSSPGKSVWYWWYHWKSFAAVFRKERNLCSCCKFVVQGLFVSSKFKLWMQLKNLLCYFYCCCYSDRHFKENIYLSHLVIFRFSAIYFSPKLKNYICALLISSLCPCYFLYFCLLRFFLMLLAYLMYFSESSLLRCIFIIPPHTGFIYSFLTFRWIFMSFNCCGVCCIFCFIFSSSFLILFLSKL